MPVEEVISLLSDDESAPIPPPLKRRRTITATIDLCAASEDEVVVVSHKKRGTNDLAATTEATTIAKAEGEIECVGEQRGVDVLTDYPHFRFQCAKLIWPINGARGAKRQRHCARCFCYVCDVPAAECPKWQSHEHAHDGTPAWRAKRRDKLEKQKRLERGGSNHEQQAFAGFSNAFGRPTGAAPRITGGARMFPMHGVPARHVNLLRRSRKRGRRGGAGKRVGVPR